MICQYDALQQEIYMLKRALCCLIVLLAVVCLPCNASPLGEYSFETISISADEAFEDLQPNILHFNGNFMMQSNEWRLESKQATVSGRPDKPDKIHLEGEPARFMIDRKDGEILQTIEASAPVIEYLRSANLLKLSGGAVLKLDEEVIRSAVIEFDLDSDRYRASGADGVMIEVPPTN